MIDPTAWSRQIVYVVLLFALFVIPRVLQRFRVPTAVTSFLLGAIAGLGPAWFVHDPTIQLLSTFGIVSLFLFAGLDVDLAELRSARKIIVQHVLLRVVVVIVVAWAAGRMLGLPVRPALLVSLAVLTPSTGFILDSLQGLGVGIREQFWIRAKGIATELVALAVLFVTLQSSSMVGLAQSSAILVGMILVLPLIFRGFAALVAPHAPRSEFAFLVMLAVVCASITRELGVYYLVGAFIVGMAADRFRDRLPEVASAPMLHAVEAFGSFFVPFYFFHAGLELKREDFTLQSIPIAAILVAAIVPLRLVLVAFHRGVTLQENLRAALRVGVPLLPTLVFGLVVVDILRESYHVEGPILGGLVLYTLFGTLLPGFLMGVPPPRFEDLELPEEREASKARSRELTGLAAEPGDAPADRT
jgi:Kef-type K+ transport system membrane component KefB